MLINNMCSDPLDVIILAGQSNMEGNGKGEDSVAWLPDDDILLMSGEIKTSVKRNSEGREVIFADCSESYYVEKAKERLADDGGCCGILALWFAKLYKEKILQTGRKILLLQTAVGGTGFTGSHWGRGDVLSERMFKMAKEALSVNEENRIVGVLWHQGEHDAFENAEKSDEEIKSFYKSKLLEFVFDVRDSFGKIPFVAGGFTHGWIDEYPEETAAIIEAYEEICREIGSADFIKDTLTLESNNDVIADNDTVHFSRKSLRLLGEKYFTAFENIIK